MSLVRAKIQFIHLLRKPKWTEWAAAVRPQRGFSWWQRPDSHCSVLRTSQWLFIFRCVYLIIAAFTSQHGRAFASLLLLIKLTSFANMADSRSPVRPGSWVTVCVSCAFYLSSSGGCHPSSALRQGRRLVSWKRVSDGCMLGDIPLKCWGAPHLFISISAPFRTGNFPFSLVIPQSTAEWLLAMTVVYSYMLE